MADVSRIKNAMAPTATPAIAPPLRAKLLEPPLEPFGMSVPLAIIVVTVVRPAPEAPVVVDVKTTVVKTVLRCEPAKDDDVGWSTGREDEALVVNSELCEDGEAMSEEENVTVGETKVCETVPDVSGASVRIEGTRRDESVLSPGESVPEDEDVSSSGNDDDDNDDDDPSDPLEDSPAEGRDNAPVVVLGAGVV